MEYAYEQRYIIVSLGGDVNHFGLVLSKRQNKPNLIDLRSCELNINQT